MRPAGDARRRIELSLAALVAGGGLFTAFVTDASPQNAPDSAPSPAPFLDPGAFTYSDASQGSRRAVAAALAGSGAANRLSAPARGGAGADEAGAVALSPDVALRAHARSQDGAGWSGSALGVQVTASTRALSDLPPVSLVGGAGRESYMIAPGGMRQYTLAPAGVAASVGDAHFGAGIELTDDLYITAGYVREQRRYRIGARDWSEDDHYAGVTVRTRW